MTAREEREFRNISKKLAAVEARSKLLEEMNKKGKREPLIQWPYSTVRGHKRKRMEVVQMYPVQILSGQISLDPMSPGKIL